MASRGLWLIGVVTALCAGFLIWTGKGAVLYGWLGGDREFGAGDTGTTNEYRGEELQKTRIDGGNKVHTGNKEIISDSPDNTSYKSHAPDKSEDGGEGAGIKRNPVVEPAVYYEARKGDVQRLVLPVPFQPQAPFGDWRDPWEDTCEEASLVLANRFARSIATISREEMRDEILELVAYQNKTYGDYRDSDAERTAEIGRKVYGMKAEVREVTQAQDVVEALRLGDLVIAPMAGRELYNPYFRPPGPWYHMLVIRGFDHTTREFITNDVGTRRGEGYRYSYEVIVKALHDFPGERERMDEGKKAVLVVSKQ